MSVHINKDLKALSHTSQGENSTNTYCKCVRIGKGALEKTRVRGNLIFVIRPVHQFPVSFQIFIWNYKSVLGDTSHLIFLLFFFFYHPQPISVSACASLPV